MEFSRYYVISRKFLKSVRDVLFTLEGMPFQTLTEAYLILNLPWFKFGFGSFTLLLILERVLYIWLIGRKKTLKMSGSIAD